MEKRKEKRENGRGKRGEGRGEREEGKGSVVTPARSPSVKGALDDEFSTDSSLGVLVA